MNYYNTSTHRRRAVPEDGGSDNFVLNFFPATFSSEQLSVFVGPYGNDESYSHLLSRQDNWTAWRDIDDGARVFAWVHTAQTGFQEPSFRPAVMRIRESTPLFCRAMMDGIERHLDTLGFSRHTSNSFVNWNVGNFLAKAGINALNTETRYGIYPKIIIDSFVTRFGNAGPFIGVIVDLAHTVKFDIPISELITASFNVFGYYAKIPNNSPDHIEYRGQVIGRIERVDRGQLVLQDTRDNSLQRIDASHCVLEPKLPTVFDYIRHCYGSQSARIVTAIEKELKEFSSPKRKLYLIQEFVRRRLSGAEQSGISISPDLTVSIGSATECSFDSSVFRAGVLNAPVYCYDPESPKTHSVADLGLKQFGPYSKSQMKDRTRRILVIAPEIFKGNVEQFISRFKSGIRGYETTYSGFRSKYHLPTIEIVEHYFPWKSGSAKDAYYNGTVSALDSSTDYDMSFVVIRGDFEQLTPTENPYFVCKSLLLSFGITVQDIKIETIRMPEKSLQWTLNTLALASYAKLGGTPYVLKARQLKHHELVIGIGRSIERAPHSRLGSADQIIGFTAIFRSDGDYLLSGCTPYANIANYQEKLEEVIRKAVSDVALSEGIADGETIRLIFHVYKRTGRREAQAIQNAIAKLTRYTIEFALLHLNDSHDFKLFNVKSSAEGNANGASDTDLIPPRQRMVEIGPRERLITFIGPKQYRRRGIPAPLRITLDRASTYNDLDYLSQQAYEFSCISWRSFNPSTQPVTVFYSELMARLNSRLRQVGAWNQELVRTKLSRKLWFI
jgi:hypothetical protein